MEASNTGQGQEPTKDDPAAATDAQERTEGAQGEPISGSQGEQVAADAPGGIDQSTPVATSAPSPARQSGVPLKEDREAGVEPGPVNPGDQTSEERPAGADQTSPSAASPNE